jgi:hypothetical protein
MPKKQNFVKLLLGYVFLFHSYQVESSLIADDCIIALDLELDPWEMISCPSNKKFIGDVSKKGFKIVRNIAYRNTFMPIISGSFTSLQNGTLVMIRMRMHIFAIFFAIIWNFVVICSLVAATKTSDILISLGIFVWGGVMVYGGFWSEVRKTKPVIREVFHVRV